MTRLMLDWFPNPDHVPLYATDPGVEIVLPADPDEALAAVADGRVDLALNYQPNVTLARARGIPVRSVGLLIDQVLDTLMVRADGPVRSVTDLAGRRVAYAVEPFDRVMFEAMAEHAGLAPGSWSFVDVGFEFTRALVEGRVDAVMGAFRNYEVIESAERGVPVRVFELADHGVPPFYQLVLVTHDDRVASREVTGAVARVAAGIALTLADPEWAYARYLEAHPDHADRFHRRAFDATLPVYARSQRQDERRWTAFAEFLRARGAIERVPRATELYTDEPVPA